jgi:hypothetical protein
MDIGTKKVWQISIWGDALGFQYEPLAYFKKFSDQPLKATILEKFTFTIEIETLSFATHCFSLWQSVDHRIKPVSVFLPTSPVG